MMSKVELVESSGMGGPPEVESLLMISVQLVSPLNSLVHDLREGLACPGEVIQAVHSQDMYLIM